MTTTTADVTVKVADEAWIATALLHRQHPKALDFAVEEIVERAREEAIVEPMRPGLYTHIVQHCVANRPPNPGRYRMLFETTPGRRRLFRPDDPYHPARRNSKTTPASEDMPERYKELLGWYRLWSEGFGSPSPAADPLLALRGAGKALWGEDHADDYVRRLREGWK